MSRKLSYKNQCRFLSENTICLPHLQCNICSNANNEKNIFCLAHNIVLNCIKDNKQYIIIEVIIRNKTNQIIKNISLCEGLITHSTQFALKDITVIQNNDHIEPVTTYNYTSNTLYSGELLIPSNSWLSPFEEVKIIYDLHYIGLSTEFLNICSCIDLSGFMVDHEHSRLLIEPPKIIKNDKSCVQSQSQPIICSTIIINCNDFCDKCEDEFCYSICNDNKFKLVCISSSNDHKHDQHEYNIYSFKYSVTGPYHLVTAQAITGDNCIIPILDWATNTVDPEICGKFKVPIGRPITCDSLFGINFLKFVIGSC